MSINKYLIDIAYDWVLIVPLKHTKRLEIRHKFDQEILNLLKNFVNKTAY